MKSLIDQSRLSSDINYARQTRRLSLRELAEETGISFSTVSRMEQGGCPELLSYIAICNWLRVPFDTYITDSEFTVFRPHEPPIEMALAILRADPDIDGEKVATMCRLVRDVHSAFRER